MFELTRILAVIDPESKEQPALARARQLAHFADAELELFIADYRTYLEDGYYFDPIRAQALRREHGEKHMQFLEGLAGPLRDNGLDVSCSTAWGNPPWEEVVRRTRELHPDLVISATRHHEKLARLLLSNDDWELIRYCPAPLLLVKDRDWASSPVFIAAVDPDHSHDKPAHLDHKLASTASALAAASDGAVHLYHSTHLPPLSGLYPIHSDYQVDRQKVTALATQYGIAAQNCHVSDLDIKDSLPDLARQLDASVVVMGAVSRSRLDRMLIGNTAERLLDRLECDVLVVKPEGARPRRVVM